MDVLIKKQHARSFLAAAGKWTRQQSDALSFPDTITALRYCLRHGLHEILLLVVHEHSKNKFTISPFSDSEPNGCSSPVQDSVRLQAQSIQLKQENKQLRRELNGAVFASKEERTQRPVHVSFCIPGAGHKSRPVQSAQPAMPPAPLSSDPVLLGQVSTSGKSSAAA